MNFCPASLPARWFSLAALLTAVSPAAAQQTIQFSKPVDEDSSAKANIVQPANIHQLPVGAFNAPSPLFGDKGPTASFDVLPGGPPPSAVSAATAAQWRQFLDGKKNWTLMTPEEILNVPTPEKILGITDPQNDPNLSAEERFLQRQDRLADAGATNAVHRPDAPFWGDDAATADPFHTEENVSRFAGMLGGSNPDPAKNSNPFLNKLAPGVLVNANPKSDSLWSSPFSQPEQFPKQTPEQQEGMDRFRALLQPAAQEKTSLNAGFPYPPTAAPDPNLQALPAYNPAGRSFSALENNSSKPKGLMPLPGISDSRLQANKPAPLVQPPPWLSDTPQAFILPQRQF